MKEKDEILKKAIESMKLEQIPEGPSKDLVDSTVQNINEISSNVPEEHFDEQVVTSQRFMIINNLFRLAAVIILSISIGYAAGRFSAPKPDIEQIRSELEPTIREKLLNDVTQYVQLGLESNYVQTKQELTEQYRQDLNQASAEILNTSGAMTNQLLEELIQTIATSQLQNRQWVATVIQKTEKNRLEDRTQFGNALFNFASATVQDLQQTQQNVALLANFLTNTDDLVPNDNENSEN